MLDLYTQLSYSFVSELDDTNSIERSVIGYIPLLHAVNALCIH